MPSMNPVFFSASGDPDKTMTYTFTDDSPLTLAQILETGGLSIEKDDGGGKRYAAIGVLISVETQDARFAINASPTGGNGHLIYFGTYRYFAGREYLTGMRLANGAAGSNSKLVITVEF